MTGAGIPGAESLFLAFLQEDPHYLEVASVYGDAGPEALHLALERDHVIKSLALRPTT